MLPTNYKVPLKVNMVLNAIRGLMGIAFPLISFPYISKILGVENIGKFNFSNSIISYFILFAGLGINTYAIRKGAHIREDQLKFKHFADEVFSINLISTAVSYVLMIIMIFLVPKFQDYFSLLIVLSLQVVFKSIGIEWIYSIYENYVYITIRTIIFQIMSLVLLFLLVNEAEDLILYAAITVLSSVGSNLLNYFKAKSYCKVQWTSIIDWKLHIKPIMILFALSVTVTIYVTSDLTILGFLCGDTTVGIYSVSTKVYSIVKTIISSVLIVSIPRLSALIGIKNTIEFNIVATDIYITLLTIVIPSVTGIIVLREQIVLLISDSTYLTATTSLALLSVALVFCMGAWFWGQCILIPLRLESVVFKATVASALINIILNIIMIPRWKENAAAFTTILAEGLTFFWCMYVGKKHTRIKGIGKILVKVGLGCAAIILCYFAFQPMKQRTLLFTLCTVFSSIVIYVIIEYFLKNEAVLSIFQSLKNRLNNSSAKKR